MRKNFLPITLLLTAILLLFSAIFINQRNHQYPEQLFKKEAIIFDQNIQCFIENIHVNLQNLSLQFEDSLLIQNTVKSEKYLIEFLNKHPEINNLAFTQNNYKISIHRDNKSLVIAADSTDSLDLVLWKRFDNGKLIGSWSQSFETSFYQTKWYQNLIQNQGKIHWFFGPQNPAINPTNDTNQLIILAYPYLNKTTHNILIYSYTYQSLRQYFKTFSRYNQVLLAIKTVDDQVVNISKGLDLKSNTDKISIQSDSLLQYAFHHYNNLKNRENGIFNFQYRNETIWNSYNRLSNENSVSYFLLSIPNQAIEDYNSQNWLVLIILALAGILMFLGIVLLIFKNRNRSSRSTIFPSLDELLMGDEGRTLEFKSSLRWDYRQLKPNAELEQVVMKTIAAFGNTDGGILLIGVDDDKNIIGIANDLKTLKKQDTDYYEIHLRNILHANMGIKYVSKNIRIQFEKSEEDRIVCKVKVHAANEPMYLKTTNKSGQTEEKMYVRSGNGSHEIKSIADINDYINTHFKTKKQ
jgi:hypothetical protein